jgi:hypothetical protein
VEGLFERESAVWTVVVVGLEEVEVPLTAGAAAVVAADGAAAVAAVAVPENRLGTPQASCHSRHMREG